MDDHEYQPHPDTGRCLGCPRPMPRRAACAWCGHYKAGHTGNPDAVVLKHYEIVAPGPIGGKPVVSSRVRWSPTACGLPHCACRKYEHV